MRLQSGEQVDLCDIDARNVGIEVIDGQMFFTPDEKPEDWLTEADDSTEEDDE